ncbi:3-oxoacid coa-transferase [Dipodascopsis uninucleata]
MAKMSPTTLQKYTVALGSSLKRTNGKYQQILVSHSIMQGFQRSFSSGEKQTSDKNSKVVSSAAEAIKDISSNITLLCGGFGLCGIPETLIDALKNKASVKNITAVSNNAGTEDSGLSKLLTSGQVSKMIASYIGGNKVFEAMYLKGKIALELTPQGSLAERCRAGGAGIPAFYVRAGYGTWVESGDLPVRYSADGKVIEKSEPKEIKEIDGRNYLMEKAIVGDVSFIKAHKADRFGNCTFRLAARNFNCVMGRASKMTIVEAEEIVEPGEIPPDNVHLQGIYVDKIVQSVSEKKIEFLAFQSEKKVSASFDSKDPRNRRERIIRRAAKEFTDGSFVNLGIGMPTLAANFIPENMHVTLQSENGILGLGPYPKKNEEDPDLINAGKETVTVLPGSSFFGSEESFAMIRAGKVDMTILGAMQVSQYGDLANWALPGLIKGMGGAMDLVANPEDTRVVVVTDLVDKNGRPKILDECVFPLTGTRCVSRIITDLAVFDVNPDSGLTLIEIAEDTTISEIKKMVGAPFTVSSSLTTIQY